jgi:hypothetical protein
MKTAFTRKTNCVTFLIAFFCKLEFEKKAECRWNHEATLVLALPLEPTVMDHTFSLAIFEKITTVGIVA